MNEDDISLRHLRVLTLLLEVGSLTRAAQILDTTQPTVSKILTKLRAHFGDPLFVRVGLSMHLTEACRRPRRELGLAVFPTPLSLPRIEIGQFWHERVHRDQGHRWFRAAIHMLFGSSRNRTDRFLAEIDLRGIEPKPGR